MGSADHTFPQLPLPAWAPFNKTPSRSGPWKQAGSEEEGGPLLGPSWGDVQIWGASQHLHLL